MILNFVKHAVLYQFFWTLVRILLAMFGEKVASIGAEILNVLKSFVHHIMIWFIIHHQVIQNISWLGLVGKGGHTPPPFIDQLPFSKIPPFLEIQDVPTFHRFIGKTKVVNNCCNQFVYNFYPPSILVLEECLQARWDVNLI